MMFGFSLHRYLLQNDVIPYISHNANIIQQVIPMFCVI